MKIIRERKNREQKIIASGLKRLRDEDSKKFVLVNRILSS